VTVIDLTHTIRPKMPVYPGTEPPHFGTACTISQNGFSERKLTLYSHTGTHMDGPAHILPGAKTLDQFPVGHFYGRACVVDLRSVTGGIVERFALQPYEHLMQDADFVLLHTGWSGLWEQEGYFTGYPVLESKAAEWISELGLKGVGMDMISVDRENSSDFPIHRILLKKDTCIIENLTNLGELPGGRFSFWCLPLKLKDAEGSPVRAVAVAP